MGNPDCAFLVRRAGSLWQVNVYIPLLAGLTYDLSHVGDWKQRFKPLSLKTKEGVPGRALRF